MLIHGINFNDGGKMMKKLLKNVLSITLVLALVLSLGVTAFADGTDAKDKDDVEIIDIAFNLCTGDPCAVRMRELGYDDIRLNGISYKADAEDGVIAIQLGDLAAAKILTEKKDEAEKAGIDFDKIYIRNGKVCVKDDAGLSSDEIASLKTAVKEFMTAHKLSVSIGDIFELSNGSELKLKVRVVNFYYPAQSEPETVKVAGGDLAQKVIENGKIDAPQVTTVYLYYEGTQDYTANEIEGTDEKKDTKSFVLDLFTKIKVGVLGIAKDKDDKDDYYIQRFTKDNITGTEWAKMVNLAEKGSLDKWLYADEEGSTINEDAYFSHEFYIDWGAGSPVSSGIEPLTKVAISKNKKEAYKEFTFEDKTADLADLMNNQNDKEALAKLGYTAETDDEGNITFKPINTTVITEEKENSYKVVYMDTIYVDLKDILSDEASPLTASAAAPVALAAPVEAEESAAEPAEEPTAEEAVEEDAVEEPAEEPKEEVVEEVAEEPVEEPKEEVKEEDEEVTEGETDPAPAETTTHEAGTTETPTLTQAELDEIERKKKLAEEEAARLAAEAAAAAAAAEAPAPTEAAAEIPTDAE